MSGAHTTTTKMKGWSAVTRGSWRLVRQGARKKTDAWPGPAKPIGVGKDPRVRKAAEKDPD